MSDTCHLSAVPLGSGDKIDNVEAKKLERWIRVLAAEEGVCFFSFTWPMAKLPTFLGLHI